MALPALIAMLGVVATAVISHPFDFARVRMCTDLPAHEKFTGKSVYQFKNGFDVIKKTVYSDGITGYYRGFILGFLHTNILHNLISLLIYTNLRVRCIIPLKEFDLF
jgi:hypothetical protein